MIKKQFRIGNMTCINCQNKIEKTLRSTEGISKISVNYNTGMAKITFDSDIISFREIVSIIESMDYEVLSDTQKEQPDFIRTICFLVIMISLYILLDYFNILNLLVPNRLADSSMGYGMLFFIGLITSVHCIAMCGGINLSQCIPKTRKEPDGDTGRFSAYYSSLLYNLGRIISYTVIGFILGCIGMLIGGNSGAGLSSFLQGILKIIAGLFMVIMGINMLNLFPFLRKFTIRMPKFLSVKIGKEKAVSKQPLYVGLLNGLMPCGPLQSMQIIALASGNPITGALSMFFFSLGTVPLMLGLGTIVAALGKRFTKAVMNIGAVLVVVLGLAMLSQGGSLSGLLLSGQLFFLIVLFSIIGVLFSIPSTVPQYRLISTFGTVLVVGIVMVHFCGHRWTRTTVESNLSEESSIEIVDGVQIVNSTLSSGTYPDITVYAGIPVKWVIYAPEGSINGCNYKMILQDYGIEYTFETGNNVIEFTPVETGIVSYSCWMGMIHGSITVTDDASAAILNTQEEDDSLNTWTDSASVSSDSCCGSDFELFYDSCCGTGESCCD